MNQAETAWELFLELRKEVLETQKVRTQTVGFKITFVGAALGVIVANLTSVPKELLALPPLAAVAFDTLIASQSSGIKRIGHYAAKYLEPAIKSSFATEPGLVMWGEFLRTPEAGPRFSEWGNIALTIVTSLPALSLVFAPSGSWLGPFVAALVFLAIALDVWLLTLPRRWFKRIRVARAG